MGDFKCMTPNCICNGVGGVMSHHYSRDVEPGSMGGFVIPQSPKFTDAMITACALMIKGICMTKPQSEWTNAIEARIRCMIKQGENQS